METGHSRDITSVSVGERVLGVDEHGEVVSSQVNRLVKAGRTPKWLRLSGHRVGAGRGNHSFSLSMTPGHRVWVLSGCRFAHIEDLLPGDRVLMTRNEHDLTPLQKQVLLGKLLGDGSLNVLNFSASVEWNHKEADSGYVHWTARALGDLASATEQSRMSGYGTRMLNRRTTSSSAIKEHFSSFIGEDGVKKVPEWVATNLTPIALAFWYMDDGSLSHTEGQEDRASFAVCGFNDQDCNVLVRALARLGVEAHASRDTASYLRLSVNSDSAEALFLLVAPYIPLGMQRKLPLRYRGHEGWLPSSQAQYKPRLVEQVIESIEENGSLVSRPYALDTTIGNYFANGILVSCGA